MPISAHGLGIVLGFQVSNKKIYIAIAMSIINYFYQEGAFAGQIWCVSRQKNWSEKEVRSFGTHQFISTNVRTPSNA